MCGIKINFVSFFQIEEGANKFLMNNLSSNLNKNKKNTTLGLQFVERSELNGRSVIQYGNTDIMSLICDVIYLIC